MSLFSSLPSLPTISLFSSDPNESVKELETLAAENPEQMKELEKTLGKPITNDQELVEARYKAFSAYALPCSYHPERPIYHSVLESFQR